MQLLCALAGIATRSPNPTFEDVLKFIWHTNSVLCTIKQPGIQTESLTSWAWTSGCAAAQAAAFAGLNGTGLAVVLPCVQSILADVYSADRRGLAFGLVMTAGILGECLTMLKHRHQA